MNIKNITSTWIGTQMVRNRMRNNLGIKYINEPIKHNIDKNKKYFLYLHVPFCYEFCSFCSFHKFKYDKEEVKKYFKNIRLELQKVKNSGFEFETMYIGGGTPFVDEDELFKTIEYAKKIFDLKQISCESTPNHIGAESLSRFKGLIDRISVGVQTFDNELLKKMSRYDKYGSSEILQEKIAKSVGILPIISLDLIYNFKNQTEDMLISDLKIAKSLQTEQITTYPLMNHHYTKHSCLRNLYDISKSKEYEFYNIIRDELKEYHLNNAWSFALKDTNLCDEYTVSQSEYIGIGSGAFSYIDDRLYVNAYDLNKYHNLLTTNSNSIDARSRKFTLKEKLQYQLLMQFFGGSFCIKDFNKTFNVSIEKELKYELLALKTVQAITIKDGIIKPTKFGEYLAMTLTKEFYMGMDNVRSMLKNVLEQN